MTSMNSKKTFDCLHFKQQVQADLAKTTERMQPKAEIAYMRHRALAGPFHQQWQTLKTEDRNP